MDMLSLEIGHLRKNVRFINCDISTKYLQSKPSNCCTFQKIAGVKYELTTYGPLPIGERNFPSRIVLPIKPLSHQAVFPLRWYGVV